MDEQVASEAFRALGDPTRMRIFQFLRSCHFPVAVGEAGEVRPVQGLTVGEICCEVTGVERVTSTISFHLKELRNAGLITMEKRGKNMICSVDRTHTQQLSAFLSEPEAHANECS